MWHLSYDKFIVQVKLDSNNVKVYLGRWEKIPFQSYKYIFSKFSQ